MVSKCGKRRFRTELDAKIALASTHASRNKRREESRYYRCPDCAGFHLTSKGAKRG